MGVESALIGGGLGLLGSSMQADAAGDAADSQAAAARTAAEAAAFRPVGVTTRFGRSGYTYDPSGKVIGAGYQVAPDLAAQREGLMGLAGGSLAQAQEWASTQPYFNNKALQMGQIAEQYIADPAKASADWMNQQRNLLAPGREQQLAKVRNDLQQSGRAGLAFGATQSGGNGGMTQPQQTPQQQVQMFGGGGRGASVSSVTGYNGQSLEGRPPLTGGNTPLPFGGESPSDVGGSGFLPLTGGNTPLPFGGESPSDVGGSGFLPLNPGYGNTQAGSAHRAQQQQQQVGRAATNPEMAAYYNSIAQQDAQLASQADAYGRERTNYGIGLLGAGVNTAQQGFGLQQAALGPWSSYFGAANQIEGAGQGAMDLATALGAQQSTAGANQGRYLAAAGGGGAGYSPLGTTLMGLAGNQQFTSGLGNMFSGWNTANTYGTNPGSQQTNMLAAQNAWF